MSSTKYSRFGNFGGSASESKESASYCKCPGSARPGLLALRSSDVSLSILYVSRIKACNFFKMLTFPKTISWNTGSGNMSGFGGFVATNNSRYISKRNFGGRIHTSGSFSGIVDLIFNCGQVDWSSSGFPSTHSSSLDSKKTASIMREKWIYIDRGETGFLLCHTFDKIL